MLRAIKRLVNGILEPTGFEIRRISLSEKYKYKWLQGMDIATIIDIGANTGQFALEISSYLPHAQIYSFEPIEEVYKKLCLNTKKLPRITTFNYALGSEKSRTEIRKNVFTPASSLLEITDYAKGIYRFASDTEFELITIDKLDNFVEAKKIQLKPNVLMKIDVQGFEMEVIRGAIGSLPNVSVIIVEANFKELYKGQSFFIEILEILIATGFKFVGIYDVDCSEIDGIPIYGDAIFFKE